MGGEIRVSAIVSSYNAERFMRGCMEDLQRQTIAREMEVIVIDSASPQDEGRIVKEFQQAYPNIVYLRTEKREGLYAAWNRAIGIAKGKYITNANTDDRHHPQAFAKLFQALEDAPECALAYHYQIVTDIENETFEACLSRNPRIRRYPVFSLANMLKGCIIGSQPMWRRSVHKEYGLFDEKYKIAGDYEFWARIAQTHSFIPVAEALGVVYEAEDTLSGNNNRFNVDYEALEIQLKYVRLPPWDRDSKNKKVLADYLFGVGYRYVAMPLLLDLAAAKIFLEQAWRLDPMNARYAKTYLLRGLLKATWGLPQASSKTKATR